MKKFTLILLAVFSMQYSSAQEIEKKKTETIIIQTKTNCKEEACPEYKEIIENTLNYTKGVIFAEFDNKTNQVTVKYKTSVVNGDELRHKIAEAGYDADEVKATKEGIEKLPLCCKSVGDNKK